MEGKPSQNLHTGGNEPVSQGASAEFTAPLGSVTSGRLVFAASAAGVTIRADAMLPDLYQAHFERHVPGIRVQDGAVTIQSSQIPQFDSSAGPPGTLWASLAQVTLNGAIPWEIEFRGGVARLIADLRGLPLRALDLGSASGSMITLSQPAGVVFVYIAGSASDITIHRPHSVAVRVDIGGSVSNVTLDEQHVGAAADGIRWQTPGYNTVADRYDISIAGSASNLTIAAAF